MKCVVVDAELQGSYEGSCDSANFADGYGVAKGAAEYMGQFKAGKKHGRGIKSWPNGDRYVGEFVENNKQGNGTYTWGAQSTWAGERYSGQYYGDKRNGKGVYEWPNGDRYEGPWVADRMTGPATPMQVLQWQHQQALIRAIGKPGVKVCREMTFGIGGKERISGTVAAVNGTRLEINILSGGGNIPSINGVNITLGAMLWDDIYQWLPCY